MQSQIPAVEPPPNKHLRRRWLIGFTLLFLLLGLVFAIYWLVVWRYQETTDDAYVQGNSVQVMSQIPGQVISILADETDSVSMGQKLVVLDNADEDVALRAAKAQLALTTRQVRQLFYRVDQLRAAVSVAKDNLEKAKEDLERRQGLVVNKSISAEDLQHAKNAADNAKDALDLAKQELASAKALIGTTDLYHHPQVEQAANNVRTAYLNWQRTTIYAPTSGYVAKRPVQVGQQISTNTVLLVILPLDQIWVDANFKESQLKNIRIGQPVEITSDAYGGSIQFQGQVVGLSPGTGSAFDLLPPQNATGNWIKVVQRLPVRISIDKKQLEKYPLRVGLSITVTVNTHNRSGKTLSQDQPVKIIYDMKSYNSDLKKADQIIDQILQENAKDIQYPEEK